VASVSQLAHGDFVLAPGPGIHVDDPGCRGKRSTADQVIITREPPGTMRVVVEFDPNGPGARLYRLLAGPA
jgi:hypothetical protein